MEKYIKIPNEVIRDSNLPHNALYLYTLIAYHMTASETVFSTSKLMGLTGWKSHETVIKYFNILIQTSLINVHLNIGHFYTISLKRIHKSYIKVSVLVLDKLLNCSKEVPVSIYKDKSTFKRSRNITAMALRLYYYYILMYNDSYQYAYPTYKNITNDTGIENDYLLAINNLLINENLIKIQQGVWTVTGEKVKRNVNKIIPIKKCNKKVPKNK